MRTEMARSIPELSIDTKLLVDRLAKVQPGETITNEQLSEVIGRDVRNGAYSCLYSARAIVQRDHQVVFGTVRGVGLKRLGNTEIVNSGRGDLDRVRRTMRRAAKKMTAVDYDALPNSERIMHNAYLSTFSALAHATKGSSVKKVASQVEQSKEQLPLAATLEAFKK
jgi:hypothetical protein